jgi:hypothetical protein
VKLAVQQISVFLRTDVFLCSSCKLLERHTIIGTASDVIPVPIVIDIIWLQRADTLESVLLPTPSRHNKKGQNLLTN